MAERINAENFEGQVLKAKLPVLVEFYSDSCIPCKRMSGVVAQIEEEQEGQVLVYKVNTNFEQKLVETYGIMSAPTFLFFEAGEVKGRLSGVQKKETLLENLRV